MKLSYRAFLDEADCLTMLTIREESADADQADRTSTCEKFPSLESLRKSVDRADIADRLIFITQDDNVIGYAQVTWWKEKDGTWLYLHNEWLRPQFRSTETLTAFLAEIEHHIRALADRHGTTATAVFGTNASKSQVSLCDFLKSQGYREVWAQVDMQLSLSQLPTTAVVEGITITQPTPADHEKMWQIYRQAYAGGGR